MNTITCKCIFLVLSLGLQSARADDFQGSTHMTPYDEDTIGYNKARPHDAVAALQERLEKAETKLRFDAHGGYLLSFLDEMGIPKSSQVLVFSKTSFQRDRIGPNTPRALYFNDAVYVGFIPGSPLMEVSTADPKLGGVFYTLEQKADTKPKFVRTDQCLECHASARSMGVPGHLLRSFVTEESGAVELITGISEINHRTPLEHRWGGWYVTGTHGSQPHRGNLIGKAAFEKQEKEPNHAGNIMELSAFFDAKPYPAPGSDIVALMVLEHQVHMHNYLTRLHYESTIQIARYGHINYVTNIANSFLKYLLFVEETPLKDRIAGSSSFTGDFAGLGPFDSQNRSLRQFDLETRLFKYPCSYLIYSKAFDALPEKIKSHLYQRLHDILVGADESPGFVEIPKRTKRAIFEILAETKKDLPSYWLKHNNEAERPSPSVVQ